MNVKKTALGFSLFLSATHAPGVVAASFQILEQSPAQLGKAFAGTASDVQDATTVFFNPAAMTQLNNHSLSSCIHLIQTQSQFTNANSNTAGQAGETDELALVPNLYTVTKLNQRWALGLGVNAPYGLFSRYDRSWYGRYLATDSDLQVLNVNTNMAYQWSPQWSVAVGINYQRARVTLANSVDSTFGVAPNPATDSHVEIEGDDSDFVADLSLYWRPVKTTAIGLVWRQGGSFQLAGDANFELSPACINAIPGCAAGLRGLAGNVNASVDLPDTVTLSGSYQVTHEWGIHADLAHTRWSSISTVNIVNTDINRTLDTLELNYSDSERISLGVSYNLEGDDRWLWRAGTAYDKAPQTEPAYVTPRVPDADRIWLAVGLNYQWTDVFSLDFAYAHLFVDKLIINNVAPTLSGGDSILAGSFDSDVNIIGVQINWLY